MGVLNAEQEVSQTNTVFTFINNFQFASSQGA